MTTLYDTRYPLDTLSTYALLAHSRRPSTQPPAARDRLYSSRAPPSLVHDLRSCDSCGAMHAHGRSNGAAGPDARAAATPFRTHLQGA